MVGKHRPPRQQHTLYSENNNNRGKGRNTYRRNYRNGNNNTRNQNFSNFTMDLGLNLRPVFTSTSKRVVAVVVEVVVVVVLSVVKLLMYLLLLAIKPANGAVDDVVKIIKDVLRRGIRKTSNEDYNSILGNASLNYRNTHHLSTSISPFIQENLRSSLDLINSNTRIQTRTKENKLFKNDNINNEDILKELEWVIALKVRKAGLSIGVEITASVMLVGLPNDFKSLVIYFENSKEKLTGDMIKNLLFEDAKFDVQTLKKKNKEKSNSTQQL
uniref:Uncharacterized protein n=1 Tax=Glossina austeni TaxID=7395 RepID=A0A1A9VAJ0_GLOAU